MTPCLKPFFRNFKPKRLLYWRPQCISTGELAVSCLLVATTWEAANGTVEPTAEPARPARRADTKASADTPCCSSLRLHSRSEHISKRILVINSYKAKFPMLSWHRWPFLGLSITGTAQVRRVANLSSKAQDVAGGDGSSTRGHLPPSSVLPAARLEPCNTKLHLHPAYVEPVWKSTHRPACRLQAVSKITTAHLQLSLLKQQGLKCVISHLKMS